MAGVHSDYRVALLSLLLCVCTLGMATQRQDPLVVFRQCIQQANVPELQERDEVLKIFAEMTQPTSTIDKIIRCVKGRRADLKASEEAAEWFVGFTFDPEMARDALYEAAQLLPHVNESACFRSTLSGGNIGCLQRRVWHLNEHFPQVRSLETICSLPNMYDCLHHYDYQNQCSDYDRHFSVLAARLVYGQCLYRADGPSTPAPRAMPTPPPMDMIRTCAQRAAPGLDVNMLFPPSKTSMASIQDVTAGETAHRKALDTFCSNREEYVRCLQDTLRSATSAIDGTLLGMLDHDALPTAFYRFCEKKELIASQFRCTYESVKASTCSGGLLDFLANMRSFIGPSYSRYNLCWNYMGTIGDAQTCRIEKQLAPCDSEFVSTMGMFYYKLFSNECKGSPAMARGQLMSYAYQYVTHIRKGVFEKKNTTESELILYVMKYLCSVRQEWMAGVREVQKTSAHPVDRILLTAITPDNMQTILDFTCSNQQVYEDHASCLIPSFTRLQKQRKGCLSTLGEAIGIAVAQFMKRYDNSTSPEDVMEDFPNTVCPLLKPMQFCMKPYFEECGEDVSRAYTTLTDYIVDACWNQRQVAPQSGHGRLATSGLAVMLLVTSLNVLM